MAGEEDIQALAIHPTLSALEPDALRQIAFSAETHIFRAGEVLFRREEASDGGYFVLSGTIALGGSETQAARVVGPGTLIGDMALITETRRPATAIAQEHSNVLKITRALFRRILSEHPRSAEQLRLQIAERLHSFTRELEELREQAFVQNLQA